MTDITEFIKGQRDCEEGKHQQSNHPDYIRGYGAQYALEESQACSAMHSTPTSIEVVPA